MPTADEHASEDHEDTVPAWAHRFAERRRSAHDGTAALATEQWTVRAIASLWRLFDEATEQANQALEEAGATERILLQRTSRQYRLGLPGPDEMERQITVFASLRALGAHTSGGGHITTSETRSTIHLEPTQHAGHLRWMIPVAGKEFTPRVVEDLFLSVFSDDPAATRRISAYFTPES